MNDRMMQLKEGNVDLSKALDVGLVVTKSNEIESERHVSSSRSVQDTHVEDTDINFMNDKQPMAEIDRNTTPVSTDMSHRGGEIDQNTIKCQVSYPLLDPSFDNMKTKFSNQFLESGNFSLKKTVAQLQKDFSRMETHCVNMELKYQNQVLINGQQGQLLNEPSNKAKFKKEIKVLETINIELEHCVAKLLAENEKLHKENEHLKQTYKDLYGKQVLQLPRNQSVVRQLNAFKSERPDISKPRFASQVDVNNVLSKPVTPYYLHKVREYVLEKPHHVIAPGSSRNSSKESYGSNDMAHNYYLDLEPALHEMTSATISLGLVPNPPPSTLYAPPSRSDWDILFQSLFHELLTLLPSVDLPAPEVIAPIVEVVALAPAASTGSPSSTTIDQDAPSASNSQTTPEMQSLVISNNIEEENHDLDITHMNNDPFFGILILENDYESSFSDVIPTVVHTAALNSEHITK
nr:hypothetical protein [Tanacetum cinerariifolium]